MKSKKKSWREFSHVIWIKPQQLALDVEINQREEWYSGIPDSSRMANENTYCVDYISLFELAWLKKMLIHWNNNERESGGKTASNYILQFSRKLSSRFLKTKHCVMLKL